MKAFVCLPSWLQYGLVGIAGFLMALFIYAETTIGYVLGTGLIALVMRDEWIRWRSGERAER